MVNGTILPTDASQNITGIFSFMQWTQEASDGVFIPSILLGLWIIVFVMLKGTTNSPNAFVGTSALIMLISIMFTTMGFLSSSYMYISILLTAIGVVWAYLEKPSYGE